MKRAFFVVNLVLIFGLAPTASAYAGNCQSVVYSNHKPVYYQQAVIQTVAAPLFVFKYTGVDGGVNGAGYGQAQTQDQLDLFAERVAAKVMAAIDQRIQKEKDEAAANNPPVQPGPTPPPSTPVFSKERVLAVHCAACHTAPNQKGKLAIFDSNGHLAQNLDWTSIYDRVNSNDPKEVMPPAPRPVLSPEHKKILKAARTTALKAAQQQVAPKVPPTPQAAPNVPPVPQPEKLPKVAIPPAEKMK